MGNSSDRSSQGQVPSRWGWVVLGVLGVTLVVIPWSLIVLPTARGLLGAVGFSMRDAYLVVPLIPAIGLGVLGVWTAMKSPGQS